ncbi:MAG: hypothetical protein IJ055_07520 [Oscillospiraceae bacterium]|nr:hypothetical protein [Oscillospiraceae bacterium]
MRPNINDAPFYRRSLIVLVLLVAVQLAAALYIPYPETMLLLAVFPALAAAVTAGLCVYCAIEQEHIQANAERYDAVIIGCRIIRHGRGVYRSYVLEYTADGGRCRCETGPMCEDLTRRLASADAQIWRRSGIVLMQVRYAGLFEEHVRIRTLPPEGHR